MKLDLVYRHARRETAVIITLCFAMAAWSLGAAALMGRGPLPAEQIETDAVGGFPTWVIWSLAIPWVFATLATGWFCFFFLANDPLGEEEADSPIHSNSHAASLSDEASAGEMGAA